MRTATSAQVPAAGVLASRGCLPRGAGSHVTSVRVADAGWARSLRWVPPGCFGRLIEPRQIDPTTLLFFDEAEAGFEQFHAGVRVVAADLVAD